MDIAMAAINWLILVLQIFIVKVWGYWRETDVCYCRWSTIRGMRRMYVGIIVSFIYLQYFFIFFTTV